MKEWKANPSDFLGRPRPPKYKEKDGRFTTFFYEPAMQDSKRPTSLPENDIIHQGYEFRAGNEVRISPEGNRYKIEIVREYPVPGLISPEPKRIASVDLGLNNLVTLTNNISETPIVINGKISKSMNQYYNKKKSKLMCNVGARVTSDRLCALTLKRDHKIDDQMHKASRFVVNWCIEHGIDSLVVGKNDKWKQGINIGKQNNQHFVSVPYERLLMKITYKYEDEGIRFVETNESYTSKCSFPDNEAIEKHDTYMGRRTKRGLFQSSNGTKINADVNGSYDIIRKAFPEALQLAGGDRRCALHPVRINIA